jgi:hypothetical protein
MQTIYSQIIWAELGMKDYKIHTEPWAKTEKLVLDWIRETDIERVEKVLFDLSWITRISYEDYYDGPFFGFSQRDDEVLKKTPGHKCDLAIHDTGMLPSVLRMAIQTRMSPEELRFIANILEIFNERTRKPSGTCSLERNEESYGYKLVAGIEIEENSKIEIKMKANQIMAFLLVATEKVRPESYWMDPKMLPVFQELEALGLIKSDPQFGDDPSVIWRVTPEGEKFISILESAGEYYTAQRQAKKDAEELLEKAKTKWNSVMDSLKF